MAAVYTKRLLSGSVNGKPISISGSATGAVTIHTAVSGSGSFDEIWLWAVNISGSPVKTTIEWGEAASPIEQTIPGESGMYPIVPGLLLNNGLAVTSFAAALSVVALYGFVNRIT